MTIEQILNTTCDVFEITIDDIKSKNRHVNICYARCISIKLMAEYNFINKRKITDSVGLNRCMYYHYIKRFKDTFLYDFHLRERYAQIKDILKDVNIEPIEQLFDVEYDVKGYYEDDIEVPAMSKEKFIMLFKQAEQHSKDSFCIANCGSVCLDKCEKFSKFVWLINNK